MAKYRKKRFYRTYEELKPEAMNAPSLCDAGFYRTYEELKLPGEDEESDESLRQFLSYL